jgi:hypothetical protein
MTTIMFVAGALCAGPLVALLCYILFEREWRKTT